MQEINENQAGLSQSPQDKKWYTNKTVLILVVLIILAALLLAVYFILNKPQNLGPVSVQHHATKSIPLNQFTATSSPKAIYVVIQYDPNFEHDSVIGLEFFSFDPNNNGSPTKLFTLKPSQSDNNSNSNSNFSATSGGFTNGRVKFCAASDKIYVEANAANYPVHYLLKEIDLSGNIRNLDFTNNMSDDWALSTDCQRVAWSAKTTTYTTTIPQQVINSVHTMYVANINGQNKKELLNIQKNTDVADKNILQWSSQDPSVLYVTGHPWDNNVNPYNNSGGGLFKVHTDTNNIEQVYQVPNNAIVDFFSTNDEMAISGSNTFDLTNGFISTGTAPSLGFMSPSGGKYVYYDSDHTVYVSNNTQVGAVVAKNALPIGWLSDNNVFGAQGKTLQNSEGNGAIGLNSGILSLVNIKADGSGMSTIATTTGEVIFLGLEK